MNEYSHFYRDTGELVEGVSTKDARAQRLLPSVTTLIKRELPASFGLTQWKERRIAATACTMYDRQAGNDVVWQDSVREKAMEETRAAAERGKEMHESIRRYLAGAAPGECPAQVVGMLNAKSMDRHLEWGGPIPSLEQVQVCERWGFAGTVDYHGKVEDGYGIVDFKTQNVTRSPQYYSDWLQQLAGYQLALTAERTAHLYNMVIDRETGRAWMRKYTPETVLRAQRQLALAACQYWIRSPVDQWPPGVRRMIEGSM